MRLSGSRQRTTGHDARLWPVLVLLLVGVLVPTVAVLWFMGQAMRNEQLAVQQKLSDLYQAQLLGLQQELQLFWQRRSADLEIQDPELPSSLLFAERIRGGLADGIVVYDTAGHPAYPAPTPLPNDDLRATESRWRRAERLERSGQNEAAAKLYAMLASELGDPNLTAWALQAQARCLVKADQKPAAISILIEDLGRPELADAIDSQGRLIAPSAQLRALQLIGDVADFTYRGVAKTLTERLLDYGQPVLPAAQRLFLMKELDQMLPSGAQAPDTPAFDTLPAEELAGSYLASDPPTPPTTSLQASGLPGIWHLASPNGSVVALFEHQRLAREFELLISDRGLPPNTTVELLAPGVEPDGPFLVSLSAGGFLQDWLLVLQTEDQALFATAASQRVTAYRLTGALVVSTIILLSILAARAVQRQLRLTRLKNDLLSTVSHELKTPLASMRLLVDTLLETGIQDSQRVREYLHLIAKENVRLSRLVDNFLTFSRMEQNRQGFEKQLIPAAAVVEAATSSVAERFRASGCSFEVEAPPDLPAIFADPDALVTVLLNLLDNATKYSGEEKHIALRSYLESRHVCFAVQDNGIGLSSRVAGKIFDRFYQVDQSLSRSGSGCGLGLSIVKYIVDAHAGTVEVDSSPGSGSTFTVRLPIAKTGPDEREEQETNGR